MFLEEKKSRQGLLVPFGGLTRAARAEDVACFNKSKSVLVATKTTGSCFLSVMYGLGVSGRPSPLLQLYC